MNAPAFNAAILHAIAVGLDRLNDGDPGDRNVADRVIADMARNGLVFERGGFVPSNEATCGYVRGSDGPEYVFIMGNGSWSRPVEGVTLFLDEGCSIPLRTL